MSDHQLVKETVDRVDVHPGSLGITLKRSDQNLTSTDSLSALTIAWAQPQTQARRELIEPPHRPQDELSSALQRLITAIATGHGWFKELASGKVASIEALSLREGKHARSIRSMLALLFLASDIVERVLGSHLPSIPSQTEITQNLPSLWSEQRALFEQGLNR
jgi:hypothetical protein